MDKKHILCTVDFSSGTPVIIETAVTLAKCFNAKLTVLTVVKQLRISNMDIDKEREKDAHNRLTELLRKYNLDKAQIKIMTDYPKRALLEITKELEVDLIVMGSHGHYGIAHQLLGSTTRLVVNDANCDVYIVHY